jgi:hypothetical protein
MDEIRPYPHLILRLNCVAGFIDAVYDMMPGFDTQLEAYEAVERMHERYFGKRRYEDYTYFISARSKYYRRLRAKKQ